MNEYVPEAGGVQAVTQVPLASLVPVGEPLERLQVVYPLTRNSQFAVPLPPMYVGVNGVGYCTVAFCDETGL